MPLNKITSNASNLQVLYEDNHLIAVNKRVGDIVQGDKTGDSPLSEHVKEYIKKKYDKPGKVFLGVIHRLDRPTTGVVVFARTSKALSRMNKLFAEKATRKVYWALVKNKLPQEEGKLVHWLKRNQKQNKSYAYAEEVSESKKAELEYKVLKYLDRYSLVEILLLTGRHHQIRAQLSKIGAPIRGDLKYGFNRSNPDGGIHLHARELSFEHPVKKEQIKLIAAPPDEELWNACV
ncbi:RluA family pseudouridine synthase [Muriicola soli]|uniref:RNA pseudouridine synthase n=1 Tax=Muriicola soli TaxID=2507538 RepID=A0A411E9G1_9FLAO|nr:RNA pseudouridine synthase [Muriicola soli]QBA64332.1 RNA pseudouridine synthase [Muriicola soli]